MRTWIGARLFRRGARVAALGLAAALLAAVASPSTALGNAASDAGGALGKVDFHASCNAAAQPEFNRAVALLHHMTYPRAREAFEKAAASDPACVMAHWGIAMTLFHPLWPTRPSPKALAQGWDETQRAKALRPPTERERLFVAAAEAFFLDPASTDYWLRVRRWEAAMKKVYDAFPDDDDAATLYALSLLATAPANSASTEHQDEAAAILLTVYRRSPEHPGAMHYLVHANDVPGREHDSLDIVRKYETIAPENAHALHMPTHIFTRLGDWDGVIAGNLRAAAAALKSPAGDHGEFVWDEFPHAIEYLIYAYLQKGQDADALAQLMRLRGTARLQPTFKTAFHLSSTQARYALERRAWQEAAALAPREPATLDWDRFAWPEAITRFARGLGDAHLGRLGEAREAAARLALLEAASRKAGEELFARNIGMLRLELLAWVAHADGKEDQSLALMRQAVDLETSTPKAPVTPGPTLPADELLGDLLMEQKRPAEALAAYEKELDLYPRHFNGLLGAARAAHAAGEDAAAKGFYSRLLEVAPDGTRQPAMSEAKAFTAKEK